MSARHNPSRRKVRVTPLFEIFPPYAVVHHSFVEIVLLDLVSETSHPLLLTHAPDAYFENYVCRPIICGDIAIIGSLNQARSLL